VLAAKAAILRVDSCVDKRLRHLAMQQAPRTQQSPARILGCGAPYAPRHHRYRGRLSADASRQDTTPRSRRGVVLSDIAPKIRRDTQSAWCRNASPRRVHSAWIPACTSEAWIATRRPTSITQATLNAGRLSGWRGNQMFIQALPAMSPERKSRRAWAGSV